jgi:hypothetical protein
MARPTPEITDGGMVLSQRGAEPGWGLVRLGLTLLQVSLIVFLAAVFIGYIGILFSGSPALSNPFRADNPPVVIIAAFIALTAAVTGFIGLCLCCTAPSKGCMRSLIRAAVALLLLGGVASAAALVLPNWIFGELPAVQEVLIGVASASGAAVVWCWLLFLKGVAHYFRNDKLAQNVGAFLDLAFFLFVLNIVLVAPFLFGLSRLLLFVPLIIPCALFGWHLRLVIRVRHIISPRNQPGP